jgi:hypothetical protein
VPGSPYPLQNNQKKTVFPFFTPLNPSLDPPLGAALDPILNSQIFRILKRILFPFFPGVNYRGGNKPGVNNQGGNKPGVNNPGGNKPGINHHNNPPVNIPPNPSKTTLINEGILQLNDILTRKDGLNVDIMSDKRGSEDSVITMAVSRSGEVWIYVCMYVYVICMYVCMCVYTCVCMYAYIIYIYTYVSIHTCIYI